MSCHERGSNGGASHLQHDDMKPLAECGSWAKFDMTQLEEAGIGIQVQNCLCDRGLAPHLHHLEQ